MSGVSASETLVAAAVAALGEVEGLNGAYDGLPVKASLPYAVIAIGQERDWGWKGGDAREIRMTLTIRDASERPVRLRTLMAEAERALCDMSAPHDWRVVNVVTLQVSTAQKRAGEWTARIELRIRMERS